jgi:hypothetical protein
LITLALMPLLQVYHLRIRAGVGEDEEKKCKENGDSGLPYAVIGCLYLPRISRQILASPNPHGRTSTASTPKQSPTAVAMAKKGMSPYIHTLSVTTPSFMPAH